MKVPNLRWSVAFSLFFAALLNYVDRNILGLLVNTSQKDLPISNQEYASIVDGFLIAFTFVRAADAPAHPSAQAKAAGSMLVRDTQTK